jgi:hypothetical protein
MSSHIAAMRCPTKNRATGIEVRKGPYMNRNKKLNKDIPEPAVGKEPVNEIEELRERALEVISCYERTKSAIRKEVRKEFGRELKRFEEERAGRENVVRQKMAEIDNLQGKIESLSNSLYGLKSKSKLWEHECARISEAYYSTVLYYSNPGLVEVQLQVIAEYADALARFVASHKWQKDTASMAEEYCDAVCRKMDRIVQEIKINLIEDISISSTKRNIEARSQE